MTRLAVAGEASPLLSPSSSPYPAAGSSYPFPPTSRADDRESPSSDSSCYKASLVGFYLYSIASEVWIIAAGTLFLPVLIETYARSHGRISPDFNLVCPSEGGDAKRCAVNVFGLGWIDTASFSLLVYSTSVAVQALTVISIGVLADDPLTRHRLLLAFATLGSLASLAFLSLPSQSRVWPLCTVFALVANVSFGCTGVCLNSYLPTLAKLSPNVSTARQSFQTCVEQHRSLLLLLRHHRHLSSTTTTDRHLEPVSPLLTQSPSKEEEELLLELENSINSVSFATNRYNVVKAKETSRISSRAIAMGYGAGISVLIGLLPVVNSLGSSPSPSPPPPPRQPEPRDETWPLRVAVGFSATWWLVGSLVASRYLKPPPPPPPLSSIHSTTASRVDQSERMTRGREGVEAVRSSWRGLGQTLKEWRKLPTTFTFLSAWFLLSDSFATLTSTAILFAKTTLNLPTSSLILVSILTPLSGILGSLLFPYLQHHHHASPRFKWFPSSNLSVLTLLVLASTLIPLWGLISLTSSTQLYALAVGFGGLYGSFQSYSRSCFAELVPSSQSGRWFGLYSITDKSSSFLGPLLVSIITNQTGQIRHGFYLILTFFLMSIPILFRVDMEKGSKDVERFEQELERASRRRGGGRIGIRGVDDDDDEEEGEDEP